MRFSEQRAAWLARQVLPHEPALRAWLRGRCVPGLELDDVVQETYAILASRPAVDDILNPRAYAFQTASNVILAHIRRSRVVSIRAVADIERVAGGAFDPSPEAQVADRDELFHLAEAIAAMPRQIRIAFTLRRIEGLSQREIAGRMQLSESTVEKHIGKGIKFLMDRFGRGGRPCSDASLMDKEDPDFFHARPGDQPGD